MPSVKQIVTAWLQVNSKHYDGLVNCHGECGCELADLMPCTPSDVIDGCEAAHKVPCTGTSDEDLEGMWGQGWCEGRCKWHMKAGPRP